MKKILLILVICLCLFLQACNQKKYKEKVKAAYPHADIVNLPNNVYGFIVITKDGEIHYVIALDPWAEDNVSADYLLYKMKKAP